MVYGQMLILSSIVQKNYLRLTAPPSSLPFKQEKSSQLGTPCENNDSLSLARFDQGLSRSESEDSISEISDLDISDYGSYDEAQLSSVLPKRPSFSSGSEKMESTADHPGKQLKYAVSLGGIRRYLDEKHPEWPSICDQSGALNGPFAGSAVKALQFLSLDLGDLDARTLYIEFTKNLRSALDLADQQGLKSDQDRKLFSILQEACHARFTQVYPYLIFEGFIGKALHSAKWPFPELQFVELAEQLEKANQSLAFVAPEFQQMAVAREWKKLQGTVGVGFDPQLYSNTPWVHSVLNEGETLVLRHGTPTTDPGVIGALFREALNYIPGSKNRPQSTIVPEFKAHLSANQNETTLYVNHQSALDLNGIRHGEGDRSAALHALEKDFKNFYCISLPLDGPLWDRKFLADAETNRLKNKLFDAIKNRADGVFYSDKIKLDYEKIDALISDVHHRFFDDAPLDSIEKKRAFMMLVYSDFKDLLHAQLRPKYIVSACKDNKDRGNASTMVDMVKNAFLLGIETDPRVLREIFFSALAPFVIKNESIIPDRLQLATDVIRYLATRSAKGRLPSPVTGFQVRSQVVPQEKYDWPAMAPPALLAQLIERACVDGDRWTTAKCDFQSSIVGGFKTPQGCGSWNLPKLKKQLERDLSCMDVQVNDKRITDFDELRSILNLNDLDFNSPIEESRLSSAKKQGLTILSMLQQGSFAPIIENSQEFLSRPNRDFFLKQADRIPALIKFDQPSNALSFELELALMNPATNQSYPVYAQANVPIGGPALISWSFSREGLQNR